MKIERLHIMPLRVKIDLVGYYGVDRQITEFFIGREEDLKGQKDVHRYTVSDVIHPWNTLSEFEHQYSDGAEICAAKALEALQSVMTPEILNLIHQPAKPRPTSFD